MTTPAVPDDARSLALPVPARAAFAHRDFRFYVTSSLLANLAAQMLAVAVGWQVYAMTHRAIDLGYVGLVQFVPEFAFALPGGNVADRLDRGRIVAVASLALAVCMLLLLAIAAVGTTSVAPLYVVLFLVGVARAFEGPAAQALVPGLVPPEHLTNAVTWSSTVWQASTVAGPALGGLVYGLAGATWVYGTCAAFFLLASLFSFLLRPPPVAAGGDQVAWSGVRAGLRFVRTHGIILEALSLDLFAVLLGGATALLPLYARDLLHTGPWGLGLLRSAPALGATGIALVLAYRPIRGRAGVLLLSCVAIFGVATIVFGLSRSFPLSLAALVVLGASDMVSVVIRSTVVQVRTPHEMRGRVGAVNTMFIVASSELGAFESGITAAWLGAVPAVVVGGIGTLVVVVVYAVFLGKLRAVDWLEEDGGTDRPSSATSADP